MTSKNQSWTLNKRDLQTIVTAINILINGRRCKIIDEINDEPDDKEKISCIVAEKRGFFSPSIEIICKNYEFPRLKTGDEIVITNECIFLKDVDSEFPAYSFMITPFGESIFKHQE